MDRFQEPKRKKASYARKWLLLFNSISVILSLATLVAGVIFFLRTDTVGVDQTVPKWAFLVIIALAGFVFILSNVGCFGTLLHARRALIAYAVLTFITALVMSVATVFSLLYASGVSTISSLDKAAAGAQENLETALAKQAFELPVSWVKLQDALSCCGIDFAAHFDGVVYNKTAEELSKIFLTGTSLNCTSKQQVVNSIVYDFNLTYSAAAETEANKELGSKFFCSDAVRELFALNAVYIGSAAGLLVFFQVVSLVCAIVVVCSRENSDEAQTELMPVGSMTGTKNLSDNRESSITAAHGISTQDSSITQTKTVPPAPQEVGVSNENMASLLRRSLRDFF
jgi:hypothetical protein